GRNYFVKDYEEIWNLRDSHMVRTLNQILDHLTKCRNGCPAKAVIWAHNSHLGDARNTDMGISRGEINVGQLVREQFGDSSFNVGFTTYTGTVTAAHEWNTPAEVMKIVPGRKDSYEGVFHDISEDLKIPNFLIIFDKIISSPNPEESKKEIVSKNLTEKLSEPLLERAIGVIYRPNTERWSHYFSAKLSKQFDAVIHLDVTKAIMPIDKFKAFKRDEEENVPGMYILINVRIYKVFTTIQLHQTRILVSKHLDIKSFSRNYHKERSQIINTSNVLFQVSKLTFPKNSLKLSNSIILSHHRKFNVTRPTRAPLPALPAFLTLFKTANAVIIVRAFSNLFLSILPFALRKNPNTGRRRTILLFLSTVFPLTGFGILFLAGLEQAPHTNRWRFRFMSFQEEKELCNSAFSLNYDQFKDKILGDDRIETIFVRHVVNNLVKGLSDDLMVLKTYKLEGLNYDSNVKIMENSEVEKLEPFVVYVVNDDSVVNAFSFGAARKILIFTGMLNTINYDEEFLSVILSHEIGHILQRHSSETLGFNQMMYILTGPFINDYIDVMAQKLIAAYAAGKYNQKEEKEADFVGLQLMALS
ncbi:17190_t:CDS:2, partial [Cetraspora pellucida]